jgi:hypothetical protein
MAESVIYREFHTLRWMTWTLSALGLLLLSYAISRDAPSDGRFVLGAFVALFVGQFLAAIHRVNRITLTPSRLRIGKETFERSDFDFSFGVQPPLVLSPDEASRVEEEWKLPPDHELPIAGGGWGRRRGTSMVVLREAHQSCIVAIFTRRPLELDARLTSWLEIPPDTSSE